MSALVGHYRPSAADVWPGTEPYERVIRALRGEPWNKLFGATRTEGQQPPVYISTPLCTPNTQVLQSRLLENITSDSSCVVEATPSAKRARNEVVEVEQQEPTTVITNEGPSVSNTSTFNHITSSEEPFEHYVTGPVHPVDESTPQATTIQAATINRTARLTQKLQNIAQLDDVVLSSKTSQSKAKYKPPYKIIVDSRPDHSMKNLKQSTICRDPSTGKMTYKLQKPTTPNDGLHKVANMSTQEVDKVESVFRAAEEVTYSLYFSNGWWQLRESNAGKTTATKKSTPTEVEGLCVSISTDKGVFNHYLVPLDSSHDWSRRIVCALMAAEKCQKICFGGQEIIETLYSHYNIPLKECLQWRLLDIQVGCWLLDPDHPPSSFVDCCKFLSDNWSAVDESEADKEKLLCNDMLKLNSTMSTLSCRLKELQLWELYCGLEVKIIPLLAVMQNTGIQLDTAKLLKYSDMLKMRMTMIETEAHKTAGHSFLLSSTHQLRQVLFDELCLHEKCHRSLSKTASHKFTSTSEHVLTQLQDVHPLPGLILEYRQLAKTKSTYIDGILPHISNEGTLRPFWVHTGTATGRLVSINPNIQAFPKQPINLGVVQASVIVGKDDENAEIVIREAVESRSGYSFLSADFKSIELRVLAHFSKDSGLLKAFSDDHTDVFISLACYWLRVEADQVTNLEREKTKRVVYAVVYGVGKDKLADILNIHPSHAKELMESFLGKFPGVQLFIQDTIATCRKQGYVTTLMKRKRFFPNINTDNYMSRSHAERQAVNFVIQGSAADICKIAMLKVMETLTQSTNQAKLLLQIHDELLFEIPTNDLKHLAEIIHTSLESHKTMLIVPLQVRISTGQTWASLQ